MLAKNHARGILRQAPAYVKAAWPSPLAPRPDSQPADALSEWGDTGDDADPHRPMERPELPPMPGTEFVSASPVRPPDRQLPDHASTLPPAPHANHRGQHGRTPRTPHSSNREQRGRTPHSGRQEQHGRTTSAELPPMWLTAGLGSANEATPRYGECDASTLRMLVEPEDKFILFSMCKLSEVLRSPSEIQSSSPQFNSIPSGCRLSLSRLRSRHRVCKGYFSQ